MSLTASQIFNHVFPGTIFWLAFTAAPFLLSYLLGPAYRADHSHTIEAAIAVYTLVLVPLLLICVARFAKDPDTNATFTLQPIAIFRVSWTNIAIFISEFLDFIQLCGLVFSLPNLPIPWGNQLRDGADGVLLSWLTFSGKFWSSFIVFFLWYFVASIVPLLEEVTVRHPRPGTVSNGATWQLSLTVLSRALFLTLIQAFFSVVGCGTSDSPLIPADNTVLREDSSVNCWQGLHRIQASFALFAIMWYDFAINDPASISFFSAKRSFFV